MPSNAPHILILSSWYPTEEQPFLGNFVRRHAQLLASKYRVSLIYLDCTESITHIEVLQKTTKGVTEFCARYPEGSKISRVRNRSRAFSEALEAIGKIDLIIGHVLLPHGWMFLKAVRYKKKPLIWIEHGSYFRQDVQKKWAPFERLIRRRVIAASTQIVAVSETLKADMTRFVPAEKIVVIGNHVDGHLFTFRPKAENDKTHFLHVSTLDKKTKNPKGIFDACLLLSKTSIPFHVTIVSDEDASEWVTYVKENGLLEIVDFVSAQNWEAMPGYYHDADALILNSDYETFSIVIAESLSTGTPVISTDVGIVPQLPDSCVSRTQKNNPDSLMQAMKSFTQQKGGFDHTAIAKIGSQFHEQPILKQWSALIKKYVG